MKLVALLRGDRVEHRALKKYLAEAKEFLSKEDLVQTSEKLWGAAALAVKMVAAKRGLKLEAHRSLWDFVSRLSRESGDEEIITFFHVANSLHRNFYENQMSELPRPAGLLPFHPPSRQTASCGS